MPPGLLAAGIGSLVYLGLGYLTGLSTSAYALHPLTLPTISHLTLADVELRERQPPRATLRGAARPGWRHREPATSLRRPTSRVRTLAHEGGDTMLSTWLGPAGSLRQDGDSMRRTGGWRNTA